MLVEYNNQKIDDKYIDFLKGGNTYKVDIDKINKTFKSYLDMPYFKMLNSGTSSLMLSLRSLDIPRNAKIIGPSYAHPAWLNASRFLGYENIEFVDVDINTLSMSPDELRKKISRDTGVVFFVNKNGYVGEDLFEIREICDHFGVRLIEDACNAFGQQVNGNKAGTIGDIGCYSFGTPKILTCGEGGAICTRDKKLYDKINELSYQGGWYEYNKTQINYGGNFAVPNTTRLILLSQLEDISQLQKQRQRIYEIYSKKVELNSYKTDKNVGYPMNIFLTENNKNIIEKSNKLKIDIRQGIYKSLGRFFDVRCLVSEYIEDNAIFLPVYVNEKQAEMVSAIL